MEDEEISNTANEKKRSKSSESYYICPACEEPVKFKEGNFCKNCNRYQSTLKKYSLNQEKIPKTFRVKEKNTEKKSTYIAEFPWLQDQGMKIFKWAALFVAISFPYIMYLDYADGLLMTNWKAEQYIQLVMVFIGAYGFSFLSLNKTKMEVTANEIVIKRGPVPVPFSSSYYIQKENIKRIDMVHNMGYRNSPDSYPIYIHGHDEQLYDIIDSQNKEEAIEIYEFIRGTLQVTENRKEVSRQEYVKHETSPQNLMSKLYTRGFFVSLLLNIPCVIYIRQWAFDINYWKGFVIFTVAVFLLFYKHHRKHLNFRTSRPLKEAETNAGFWPYLVISIAISFLLTPCLMFIYNMVLRFQ